MYVVCKEYFDVNNNLAAGLLFTSKDICTWIILKRNWYIIVAMSFFAHNICTLAIPIIPRKPGITWNPLLFLKSTLCMRMLLKLAILLSSCVLNQIQCVVSQLCDCF